MPRHAAAAPFSITPRPLVSHADDGVLIGRRRTAIASKIRPNRDRLAIGSDRRAGVIADEGPCKQDVGIGGLFRHARLGCEVIFVR